MASYNRLRWLARLALLFGFALPPSSFAEVVIENITVTEDSYSVKTLQVDLTYDGAEGDTIYFGATALTDTPVTGVSYFPYSISSGQHSLAVVVNKPAVANHDAVHSDRLRFRFYDNVSLAFNIEMNFPIQWMGAIDYFSGQQIVIQPLRSVKRVSIDESMPAARPLIANLISGGVPLNNLKITHSDEETAPQDGAIITLSEDIAFDDIKNLLTTTDRLGLEVRSVRFSKLNDRDFQPGQASIYDSSWNSSPALSPSDWKEMLAASNLDELYALANFQPTPVDDLVGEILQQAIALNDEENRTAARQAQELANFALQKDPALVRAYVELARSEIRLLDGQQRFVSAQKIIRLALQVDPDDAQANQYAGYIEMQLGNLDKALAFFMLAEQNRNDELIVWLTANWANALWRLNRIADADAKFASLVDLEVDDPHNERAQYFGLRDYTAFLEEQRSHAIDAIYESLVYDYPERSRCLPLTYAKYVLRTRADTLKSQELLNRAEQYNCRLHDRITVLTELMDWYNRDGNRAELYRSFIRYGEMDYLIYELASFDDGHAVLDAIKLNGVDLDQPGSSGQTALLRAIANSNSHALSVLTSAGVDVNRVSVEGFSPLMTAMFLENTEAMQILLAAGADPALEYEGYSAFDIAEQFDSAVMQELLRLSSSQQI